MDQPNKGLITSKVKILSLRLLERKHKFLTKVRTSNHNNFSKKF
jgi:hypothetical protein